MDADLIGLFALLVGLELILGVDNILVIAILVSRLPEHKRNSTRMIGLAAALLARIVMVIAGLKLLELTAPAWPDGPEWFQYSWKDLALLAGGLFLIWKAVKEIHSTVELEDHGDEQKAKPEGAGEKKGPERKDCDHRPAPSREGPLSKSALSPRRGWYFCKFEARKKEGPKWHWIKERRG